MNTNRSNQMNFKIVNKIFTKLAGSVCGLVNK